MMYIKEEEIDKYKETDGIKLFYINFNKDKIYEDHLNVLSTLSSDYSILKIFIVNKNDQNKTDNENKYQFILYDNKNLIKTFKNTFIGEITSYLRKYISNINENIIQKIKNLLNNNKVILFMKGTKTEPKCKFSNAVIYMLNQTKVKYETYDILEDQEMRNELKNYSNWPTYPQLYVEKELIGGHDIILEMFQNKELHTIFPSDCIIN